MTSPDDFIAKAILSFDRTKAREEREARMAEELKVFLAGPDLVSDIPCMYVHGCAKPRWKVPTTESVLCKDHTIEVLEGREKAPPIRRGIDYQSAGRKVFLVERLPEGTLSKYDNEPK